MWLRQAKCTKVNPPPPCGPGMEERPRPSGAICCYKSPKTAKKASVPKTAKKASVPKTAKKASVPKTAKKSAKKDKTIVPKTAKKAAKCTKINPPPPCGPGMEKRPRPNGALCCYKKSKTIKKTKKSKD